MEVMSLSCCGLSVRQYCKLDTKCLETYFGQGDGGNPFRSLTNKDLCVVAVQADREFCKARSNEFLEVMRPRTGTICIE